MRRILSLALILAALAIPAVYSQQNPLLPAKAESELFQRSLQLIESTSAAVPGLARAAAPVLENARQAVHNLESGTPGNATLIYEVLINVRAYLSLADSLPKPYPFPEEAHKQFEELRDTAGRIVRSGSGLAAGDTLDVRFAQGGAEVKVEKPYR